MGEINLFDQILNKLVDIETGSMIRKSLSLGQVNSEN